MQARYEVLRKFLPAKITLVTEPAGAKVTVDGEAQEGATPLELELPPGTHKFGLTLEGYQDAELETVLEGGIHLEQQVGLALIPPPPAPVQAAAPSTAAEEETKKSSIVPAAVTLGLGGAGLIAGTVFGILALDAKSKYKDDPTIDHADAAERNALIADMSFGVALTLGITGVVLLTSGEKDESAATTRRKRHRHDLMVAPYAGPRGAGASARLSF